MKEVKEVKEVEEAKEKTGGIAAFFDLDGTLVEPPSLERRLFRMLRYRREIPVGNYFLWLREAVRLLPRGIRAIAHGNKMYLRGVQSFEVQEVKEVRSRKRNPRVLEPVFFAEAIERVAWHALQEHTIVLMSGTLEALARHAALVLEEELSSHGIAVRIAFCATRLEEVDGRWTGRILGEAMFGEAKARAIRRLAAEMSLELAACFAYGDSESDQAMLEVVGRPTVVNPSIWLASLARRRGWRAVRWIDRGNLTRRTQRTQSLQRREKLRSECEDGLPEEFGRQKQGDTFMSAVMR